ncbi:hypothetical protein CHX26_00905 [Porphyrobacter sp. HT-58-2]|uniref:CHASE2 domain-containing protein n=1 Tax=Porphyrobacter sp. HT-58-2 TaxID=2023229 RepID=UPI000CDC210B|nr:CHASE2 domain-containing protein [Porphyrobacter sp. HT-58-2]AUX68263.1 hypothetical protein CHX26_00905 [Porphyrobacter sp. HT-58-2]
MWNQRRLALEWLLLLAAGLALAWLAAQGDLTRRFNFAILDFSASLASNQPAQDIAIVAIDQRSLAKVGEWPWRRSTHARLIDNLRMAGAKVVLFDVLFLEAGDPQDDAQLAEAIARHGKVVLPFGFAQKLNQSDGVEPAYPLPEMRKAAAAMGHVEAAPDEDGVLRRFALELQVEGHSFPHFVQAALPLLGAEPKAMALAPQESWPVVPFNAASSYPTIPAYAVLDGTVPKELLEGRTILVGATAQGMSDTHSVPARSIAVMAGVETQANLIDALRSDKLIRDLPLPWSIALAWIVLYIQFLGFWKLSARAGFVLSVGLVAGTALISIGLVPLARIWVAPGAALLLVAVAYPMWSWRRLTVVSDYLSLEARRLMSATGGTANASGFDIVAQQVNQLRHLIGEVSGALLFVRSAIEASPDAILVTDKDNRVVLSNKAARRLFSNTTDLDGQSLADLYLNQTLAVDGDNAEIALRDGRAFLFATAPLAGMNQAGEANQIIAFRDITQMRRRQRENDELIEFLSHDMRSPQVAIMALTLGIEADNADIAKRIRDQAELTLGLADGFVQLARLRETRADFESHDLAFLLHEAVDQAYALAASKGISLQRDIPDEPVFVEIDRSQIARMASNLIGNAVKFTQNGGTVGVQLALRDGSEALITVIDNGPGLSRERMRDPFTRFGPRSDTEELSAGLGLAFVKRVIDGHKGQVEAKSNPGGGTIFEVHLPCVQQKSKGRKPRQQGMMISAPQP